MRGRVGVGSLALLLFLTGTAEAQHRHDMEARGYLGVGGGLAVPSGDFGAAANLGWVGHGFIGYTTRHGILGGRLDASFGRNPLGLGSLWMGGATANAVLTPGHRPASFHPYLLAGAGAYHVNSTGGSGETALALNGGAGVQFHLGHRNDLYVEGRFLSIRTNNAVNLVPITFGFRWGGI